MCWINCLEGTDLFDASLKAESVWAWCESAAIRTEMKFRDSTAELHTERSKNSSRLLTKKKNTWGIFSLCSFAETELEQQPSIFCRLLSSPNTLLLLAQPRQHRRKRTDEGNVWLIWLFGCRANLMHDTLTSIVVRRGLQSVLISSFSLVSVCVASPRVLGWIYSTGRAKHQDSSPLINRLTIPARGGPDMYMDNPYRRK